MAAACDGGESDPRALSEYVVIEDSEMRRCRFAKGVIDHLSWAVRPIANQRQIDRACVLCNQSMRDRHVVLADGALLKRATDGALGVNAAREYHQPGGFHVEAMHHQRISKCGLYASAQAILFVRPATGNGEQAAWLVDDDKGIVDGNNG